MDIDQMRTKKALIKPKPVPVEGSATMSRTERVLLDCPNKVSFTDDQLRDFSDTVWESVEEMMIHVKASKVDLGFLGNFPGLRKLTLTPDSAGVTRRLSDLSPLAACPQLGFLSIEMGIDVRSLDGIEFCQRLSRIELAGVNCNIQILSTLPHLRTLKIIRSENISQVLDGNS